MRCVPPHKRSLLRLAFAIALASVLALCAAGPASADRQLLGAQSHVLWGGSSMSDMDREFDLLDRAGANAVRVDLSWSSLETAGNGRFSSWYVDKFEAFLDKARAHNIEVIATLWSTPCWASSAPDSVKQGCAGAWWDRGVDRYPPRNAGDYADTAAWVARRWGPRLAALEIWNEPNLPDQGFLKAQDPALAYATILKTAYPRIKDAYRPLTVLGGALAFSDEEFLIRLYGHGAKGNFDALSLHPYNEWRDPDDRWKAEWRKYTFITGVPAMHEVLRDHGDGHKQLWLTEFGFSSCGDGDRWCVNEQQQARYLRKSFHIVRRWSFVKAATAYNLRNKGWDPRNREHQFGLVHPDFTPKPAYAAFRQALLRRPAPARPRGRILIPRRGRRHRGLRVGPRGMVKVPVKCVGRRRARPCAGRVALLRRVRRGRPSSLTGARRFRMRAGKTRYVRLMLSRKSRRAVARHRRVRMVALATTRGHGRARRAFRLVRVP